MNASQAVIVSGIFVKYCSTNHLAVVLRLRKGGGILVTITDRDIKLFQLISLSGACTMEQARSIYGNASWYHYKRVKALQNEGYLYRRGKYLELAGIAAELIGDVRYRFRQDTRDAASEIAQIALSLKNIEMTSSRELRMALDINRKTYFKGALFINSVYYFLYMLPGNPTRQYLTGVKTELKQLSASGICRYGVILAPSPTGMASFTIEDLRQQELFLLPYPAGIELIDHYFHPETQAYIKSLIPGAVPSTKPFANFETQSSYVTVLILNDIARRYSLNSYYQSPYQAKPVVIICLESQRKLFARQYPGAELNVIPDESFKQSTIVR